MSLAELAKLRQAGWRTKQLSERFGVGLTTLKRASAKLRPPKTQGLTAKVEKKGPGLMVASLTTLFETSKVKAGPTLGNR